MHGINPNDATLDTAHLLLPASVNKQSPEEVEANLASLESMGIVKREAKDGA